MGSLFVILLSCAICSDINGLTVRVPVTKVAFLGDNQLELPCTYDPIGASQVYTIAWQRNNTNGDLEDLVTFSPPGGNSPVFGTSAEAVKVQSRVNITHTPTAGGPLDLTATILFTSIECGDVATYRCVVTFFEGSTKTEYATTSVSVKAKPKVPEAIIVTGVSNHSVQEGGEVQFTCKSNVGRPSPPANSAFKWSKFRKNESPTDIGETTSTITPVAGSCTYEAISTVSLTLSPEDNGVVVRCTVQHETLTQGEDLHSQAAAIDVYYRVRPPTITADKATYHEGESMTLDCLTTGNPTPTFMWYFNGTLQKMTSQYKINTLESTDAGVYQCVVQNIFNGKTYNDSKDFTLTIGIGSVQYDSPLVFDPYFYLANDVDLQRAGYSTASQARTHWLSLGIDEGRQGCGSFHSMQYLHRYADVNKALNGSFRAAIEHYLLNGYHEHRLGYVDNGFQGRWTISNKQNDVFISASSRMGGSIDSLVWNTTQFINMYDHGRELQMACNSNTYLECYNPTEAGGRDDGTGRNTKTSIRWIHSSNHVLESEVHPAFWLRPGRHETQGGSTTCGNGSPALNHEMTYSYPFHKKVTIGVAGMDHAIEFISNFTLAGDWPRDLQYIQMEAPTGYLTAPFSQKYNFKRETATMESFHTSTHPVALANHDGSAAMGVYSPPGQDTDVTVRYEGGQALGGTSFLGETNKWSVVFRKRRFHSGINHQVYKSYICVGTLNMVTNCLHTLMQAFPHA